MSQTQRNYWPPKDPGRHTMSWTWDAINPNSVVIVTASEYRPEDPAEHFVGTDYYRFVGDADVRVANISPQQGVVQFVLHVEFPASVYVCTDVTVLDGPVQIFP